MKLYRLNGRVASWEECYTLVAAENAEQALQLAKQNFQYINWTVYYTRAEEICELIPVQLSDSQPAGIVNHEHVYLS